MKRDGFLEERQQEHAEAFYESRMTNRSSLPVNLSLVFVESMVPLSMVRSSGLWQFYR